MWLRPLPIAPGRRRQLARIGGPHRAHKIDGRLTDALKRLECRGYDSSGLCGKLCWKNEFRYSTRHYNTVRPHASSGTDHLRRATDQEILPSAESVLRMTASGSLSASTTLGSKASSIHSPSSAFSRSRGSGNALASSALLPGSVMHDCTSLTHVGACFLLKPGMSIPYIENRDRA
jgi:hypothetical protein